MKILITGATGFLGREIGKRLAFRGHELFVVTRSNSQIWPPLPFPAKTLTWNPKQLQLDAAGLEETEACIHLAGEPIAGGLWTAEKKQAIQDSRSVVTSWLIEQLGKVTQGRLHTFVSASAVGFYGERGDELLNEAALPGQGFLPEVCHSWEKAIFETASQSLGKTRRVALRIGIVLGTGGGALQELLPLFRSGVGSVLGSGMQWMSWVHLNDVAQMFVHAVENDNWTGVFNAVAPKPVTNRDFTRSLAQALGKAAFFKVPNSALKLALGEFSAVLLSSQRCSTAKIESLGFSFEFPTLPSALTHLCKNLQNGQRELVREQWVPLSPKEVFPFFADELNLERITPSWLKFRVTGKSTPTLVSGTLLNYELNLHGIPMRWQSRIEEWSPNEKFVDTQIKGPYAHWRHLHEFAPMAGGTLMRDHVVYSLPLGGLGSLFGGGFVGSQLRDIFDYRQRIVQGEFSSVS